MKSHKLQIGSDEVQQKYLYHIKTPAKRIRATEMNRKTCGAIFLVFVLSLSCSLVSAGDIKNPPTPEITINIESNPQVVECVFDPKANGGIKNNTDFHVLVYEGCAEDVIIIERCDSWEWMDHGTELKLEIKKMNSTTVSNTKSKQFCDTSKLSFETNIMSYIKGGGEVSHSLTVGESETISSALSRRLQRSVI